MSMIRKILGLPFRILGGIIFMIGGAIWVAGEMIDGECV